MNRIVLSVFVSAVFLAGCGDGGRDQSGESNSGTTQPGSCPECMSSSTTSGPGNPGAQGNDTSEPLAIEFFDCARLVNGFQFEQASVQSKVPAEYAADTPFVGVPTVLVGVFVEHCAKVVIASTTILDDVHTMRAQFLVSPPAERAGPEQDAYVLEWVVDDLVLADELLRQGFQTTVGTIGLTSDANAISADVTVDGVPWYAFSAHYAIPPGGAPFTEFTRSHHAGVRPSWNDEVLVFQQSGATGAPTILRVTGGMLAELDPKAPAMANAGQWMTITWKATFNAQLE